MKEETDKDEGYKLMGTRLQLGSVTISVGAERASGQPGGLPDISRGLSARDTPRKAVPKEPHPGGVPEPVARPSPRISGTHPGASALRSLSGGVSSLRSAQPPANFCEPFGFVPPYYIRILNYT